MKPITRKIEDILVTTRYVNTLVASSLLIFAWHFYKLPPEGVQGFVSYILAAVVTTFVAVGYIYSIRVRSENIVLRRLAEDFYEINQIYRSGLSSQFTASNPVSDPKELLAVEYATLRAVVQRAALIFSQAISRKCVVTIKLITPTENGVMARTYIRSEDLSLRDSDGIVDYRVGSTANTSFDLALKQRVDGLPCHFFSSDLSREPAYRNERPNFLRFYKSTLVVPMHAPEHIDESGDYLHVVGFLCVDTLSVNRLNNSFHLYMLAALAEQMFNYVSLMRGRYRVLVEKSVRGR